MIHPYTYSASLHLSLKIYLDFCAFVDLLNNFISNVLHCHFLSATGSGFVFSSGFRLSSKCSEGRGPLRVKVRSAHENRCSQAVSVYCYFSLSLISLI